jgi:hypothetical protein
MQVGKESPIISISLVRGFWGKSEAIIFHLFQTCLCVEFSTYPHMLVDYFYEFLEIIFFRKFLKIYI